MHQTPGGRLSCFGVSPESAWCLEPRVLTQDQEDKNQGSGEDLHGATRPLASKAA
jgi:hypothetical protein